MGVSSGYKDVVATKTTSGATGDTLRFTWFQTSQSISGNYTNISWGLQLISGSAGAISSSASKNWSVTVNGTKYSGTNTIGIANNTTKTLASGTTKIAHNADGTKTFSVSFSQQFAITFNTYVGTVSGSSSWTLNTIPRYAAFSGVPAISNITQTSLKLSWSANATCSSVSYLLNGVAKSTSTISATSGSYTYTGLTPNTSYTLAVKITRSDSGLQTTSSNITSTTLPIATISSSGDISFNIGDDLLLNFLNSDKNASTLKLSVENDIGEWVEITSVTVPIGTESYNWILSDIALSLFQCCTTKNQMNIKINCGTTLNNNYYENIYTGIAYVVDSDPVFTAYTLKNTIANITDVLGTAVSTVQNMGNFQVQITSVNKAVAKNEASIVKYVVYLTQQDSNTIIKSAIGTYSDSVQVNIDLGTYSVAGTYLVNVYAIDSRNNVSSTVTKPCTIISYHIPVPSINITRLNGFEKEIFLDISILHSRALVGGISKNSISSISYRYAEVGTELPSAWTTITGYTSVISNSNANDAITTYQKNTLSDIWMNLEIEKSYSFEFKITDKIQELVISDLVVEQGIPLMGEFENGYITVGMLPDITNSALLQVNSDISATDNMGIQRNILNTMSQIIRCDINEPIDQILGGIWFVEDN